MSYTFYHTTHTVCDKCLTFVAPRKLYPSQNYFTPQRSCWASIVMAKWGQSKSWQSYKQACWDVGNMWQTYAQDQEKALCMKRRKKVSNFLTYAGFVAALLCSPSSQPSIIMKLKPSSWLTTCRCAHRNLLFTAASPLLNMQKPFYHTISAICSHWSSTQHILWPLAPFWKIQWLLPSLPICTKIKSTTLKIKY